MQALAQIVVTPLFPTPTLHFQDGRITFLTEEGVVYSASFPRVLFAPDALQPYFPLPSRVCNLQRIGSDYVALLETGALYRVVPGGATTTLHRIQIDPVVAPVNDFMFLTARDRVYQYVTGGTLHPFAPHESLRQVISMFGLPGSSGSGYLALTVSGVVYLDYYLGHNPRPLTFDPAVRVRELRRDGDMLYVQATDGVWYRRLGSAADRIMLTALTGGGRPPPVARPGIEHASHTIAIGGPVHEIQRVGSVSPASGEPLRLLMRAVTPLEGEQFRYTEHEQIGGLSVCVAQHCLFPR